MGKSAEALVKEHGSKEMVALFDAVMYRDPDDVETDPKNFRYQRATYGQRFTTDGARAKELEELGAATTDVRGERARFAMAGVRQPETLAPPPTATAMFSTSEQVRALQSATKPSGNPDDLARLDTDELRRLAVAFGVPISEKDTKASLVEKISSTAASSPDELEDARSRRDAALQRAAAAEASRTTAGDATSAPAFPDEALFDRSGVGSGDEPKATKTKTEKEPKASAETTDDLNATDGARALAGERNIDLHAVTGSGDGGRIIKPDVEKYLSDLDAAQGKSGKS